MPARFMRVIAALAAIVVCAWFAVGIRQADEVAHATSVLEQSRVLTVTQLRAIDAWLRSARRLNPDTQVDILRARAAIKAGKDPLAEQILQNVTRAEPMNLEAWIWLAGAALGDPPVARHAVVRIGQLDPRARPQ